jgi:hypothetical protein
MYTDISEEFASDPLFKIVDFLQHNWAVIVESDGEALVVFYGDTRGVFDELAFGSIDDAEKALKRNGFGKYQEDTKAQTFIGLPQGEFSERPHPNGKIYSSGRFWK